MGRGVVGCALAVFVLASCSSGKTGAPQVTAGGLGDGGDASSSPGDGDRDRHSPSSLDVRVEWPKPPTSALASEGVNHCGDRERSAVAMHSAGGVQGAVVSLGGAEPAGDDTEELELTLVGCRLEPRIVAAVGPKIRLSVTNTGEQRRDVEVAMVGANGASKPIARLPFSVVGQRFSVEVQEPGVVVLTVVGEGDPSFVYVSDGQPVSLTDGKGVAHFDPVAPGHYSVSVWHPPVSGAGVSATAEVDLLSGQRLEKTIPVP